MGELHQDVHVFKRVSVQVNVKIHWKIIQFKINTFYLLTA